MADLTFVSRRDSSFKEFPPASAQIAMVLPFFGNLTVWMRTPDAGGWHFPTSARRSGETILEVARRELWDAARIVANRLDLLGAIRYELPKPTTAYVYMCELDRLSWWYELPDKEKSAELTSCNARNVRSTFDGPTRWNIQCTRIISVAPRTKPINGESTMKSSVMIHF